MVYCLDGLVKPKSSAIIDFSFFRIIEMIKFPYVYTMKSSIILHTTPNIIV